VTHNVPAAALGPQRPPGLKSFAIFLPFEPLARLDLVIPRKSFGSRQLAGIAIMAITDYGNFGSLRSCFGCGDAALCPLRLKTDSPMEYNHGQREAHSWHQNFRLRSFAHFVSFVCRT